MISLRRRHLLPLLIVCIALLTCVSAAGAQRRKTSTVRKKAAATPSQPPSTLQGCGVSLRVPAGWELTPVKVRKTEDDSPSDVGNDDASSGTEEKPVDSATPKEKRAEEPAPPCSFLIASKNPSALIKTTDTDGPVGQMELQVVEGDLETAAATLFKKDDKGWYFEDEKGTRSDAKLTKQKTMQILTSVFVQRCYDQEGKSRGLCEVSRYVYSNGRRNLLVTAGPYLGETESVVLSSVRFVGSPTSTAKRKR